MEAIGSPPSGHTHTLLGLKYLFLVQADVGGGHLDNHFLLPHWMGKGIGTGVQPRSEPRRVPKWDQNLVQLPPSFPALFPASLLTALSHSASFLN